MFLYNATFCAWFIIYLFSLLHPVSSCSLVVHRVRPTGRLQILRRQRLLPDATLRHT
jgi:hypothetical protein